MLYRFPPFACFIPFVPPFRCLVHVASIVGRPPIQAYSGKESLGNNLGRSCGPGSWPHQSTQAFIDTNPTGELITSRLLVIRPQSSRRPMGFQVPTTGVLNRRPNSLPRVRRYSETWYRHPNFRVAGFRTRHNRRCLCSPEPVSYSRSQQLQSMMGFYRPRSRRCIMLGRPFCRRPPCEQSERLLFSIRSL